MYDRIQFSLNITENSNEEANLVIIVQQSVAEKSCNNKIEIKVFTKTDDLRDIKTIMREEWEERL